jgi:hypothetical protein
LGIDASSLHAREALGFGHGLLAVLQRRNGRCTVVCFIFRLLQRGW